MAELTVDAAVSVRLETCRMLAEFITTLPDRYPNDTGGCLPEAPHCIYRRGGERNKHEHPYPHPAQRVRGCHCGRA